MRNRDDEAEYRRIADELGLDASDVKRAVVSFFDVFEMEARKLPFDNCRRIYSREKFSSYSKVRNIPSVGRLGPSYSRYLKWRANEAKEIDMEPRKKPRGRIPKEAIEKMASDILSGKTPEPVKKIKRNTELYDRVWLVGQDGKKLARQVIPKSKSE